MPVIAHTMKGLVMGELPLRAREVTVRAGTGPERVPVIIWFVQAEGRVYVRSYKGDRGLWYRAALDNPVISLASGGESWEFDAVPVSNQRELDSVSEAYREKYADMGGWLDAMVAPDVVPATLRLEPRR